MDAKRAVRAEALFIRLFWFVPLSFYLVTVSPTPGWVDAPLIANTTFHLELSTWVNNHNLFTVVGWAWLSVVPDSLDPHYALNLLCAFFGAATVYTIALVGLALTRSLLATAIGASLLMVSHSLWWHSTMLEVYTLSTLLMSWVLLLVSRYGRSMRLPDLCGALFFFGLACSNHAQMALLAAGFVVLPCFPEVRRNLKSPKSVAVAIMSFAAGFQLYLWVFLAEWIQILGSVPEAEPLVVLSLLFDRATGGEFKRYMFPLGISWAERASWWSFYLALFIYSLPLPWLCAAPIGAATWFRSREDRVTLTFLVLTLVAQVAWSANYLVWDMYAFALPAYVLTAVLVIRGLGWVLERGDGPRRAAVALAPTILLIPCLYRAAPDWIASSPRVEGALSMLPQYEQAKAFWDPLPYFFDPNKRGYDRVERTSQVVLDRLDDDACFWGNEATILYPLWFYYQGVLGERTDVAYFRLFAILEGVEAFSHHADRLIQQLDDGCSVYVASLGYPERYVLDFAAARLDPSVPLAEWGRLSTERFAASFPRYRIESLTADPESGTQIHKFVRRAPK